MTKFFAVPLFLTFVLFSAFSTAGNSSDKPSLNSKISDRLENIEKLKASARMEAAAIEVLGAEKIPSETLDIIGYCILRQNCNSTITLMGNPQWEQNREYSRIVDLFLDLAHKGNIRVLSEDVRQKLHLDRLVCQDPSHCTTIAGFYLPMTNQIFIDTSLPKLEQTIALIHEMRHAYQFTYRFPVDLAELFKDLHEGHIALEDLSKYLDFFYEAQASWKAFRAFHEAEWVPYFTDFSTLQKLKKPGFVGSLGGHFRVNQYLPASEQTSVFSMNEWEFGNNPDAHGAWEGMPAMILPELVCVDGVPANSTYDNFDLPFHAKYCSAVEKYYFGKLPFLFQKRRSDLTIFNNLHDNYMSKLGGNDRVGPERDNNRNVFSHFNQKCFGLIEKIKGNDISPMVAWLSLSKKALGVCSVYSGTLNEEDSNQFIQLLLENFDPNSPFEILMPGGEGSHPELKINPSMKILPQLKVTPEILEK